MSVKAGEDCGDDDILAEMEDVGGDWLALTAGIEAPTWQWRVVGWDFIQYKFKRMRRPPIRSAKATVDVYSERIGAFVGKCN